VLPPALVSPTGCFKFICGIQILLGTRQGCPYVGFHYLILMFLFEYFQIIFATNNFEGAHNIADRLDYVGAGLAPALVVRQVVLNLSVASKFFWAPARGALRWFPLFNPDVTCHPGGLILYS